MQLKFDWLVAEQEDVTGFEALRLKQRLMADPGDSEALRLFSVLDEWESKRESDWVKR
jgi:hypothetical protein